MGSRIHHFRKRYHQRAYEKDLPVTPEIGMGQPLSSESVSFTAPGILQGLGRLMRCLFSEVDGPGNFWEIWGSGH